MPRYRPELKLLVRELHKTPLSYKAIARELERLGYRDKNGERFASEAIKTLLRPPKDPREWPLTPG